MQFLRNFDPRSFWVGFLVSSLFWWMLSRLAPSLKQFWGIIWEQVQAIRESMKLGVEFHYRNDIIRRVQSLHLAAKLFSLDEILVPPRLLAPPPLVKPGKEEKSTLDIAARTIPYLPDWPELAAAFDAPTLTLPEALSKNANLALMGHPSSGKTVALAHLATRVAQMDPEVGELGNLFPIYVHAGELSDFDPSRGVEILITALTSHVSANTASKLTELIQNAFNAQRVLLLLDGLDELEPESIEKAVNYLATLMENYPAIRVVAAVSPYYYDGITSLGLMPAAMAAWNVQQKTAFVENWGNMWTKYIVQDIWQEAEPAPEQRESTQTQIEPIILNNWLMIDNTVFTPLEITLKTWAAYAGDITGSNNVDALNAYVHRMTLNMDDAGTALERLALQMVLKTSPIPTSHTAERWVHGIEDDEPDEDAVPGEETELEAGDDEIAAPDTVDKETIPKLLDSGLLISHPDSRVSFAHPTIAGFFTGKALGNAGGGSWVLNQPTWTGKNQALHYLASEGTQSSALASLIKDPHDALKQGLFMVARWLRDASGQKTQWRLTAMRELVSLMQSRAAAAGLRTRALTALAVSGDPGVVSLFRKLIRSDDPTLRQLSALGLGFLKDAKSTSELVELVYDPDAFVQRSSCLALVAIGNQKAIDAIATALVHGDEDLQRTAAEALANHPQDGHELLREASEIDDLLARRASVFGLARIDEPWARETLTRMQTEDEQWVVRNAAIEAANELEKSSPFIPEPLPPIHESSWLILFAGESGEGIAPGEPAENMLQRALTRGDNEQRLAAMDYVRLSAGESVHRTLYGYLFQTTGELREAALNTLWHLAASGHKLPSPVQFGIGTRTR